MLARNSYHWLIFSPLRQQIGLVGTPQRTCRSNEQTWTGLVPSFRRSSLHRRYQPLSSWQCTTVRCCSRANTNCRRRSSSVQHKPMSRRSSYLHSLDVVNDSANRRDARRSNFRCHNVDLVDRAGREIVHHACAGRRSINNRLLPPPLLAASRSRLH